VTSFKTVVAQGFSPASGSPKGLRYSFETSSSLGGGGPTMNQFCMHRRQWLKEMFSLAAASALVPVEGIMNSPADSGQPADKVART
jgi:hypothetical protein